MTGGRFGALFCTSSVEFASIAHALLVNQTYFELTTETCRLSLQPRQTRYDFFKCSLYGTTLCPFVQLTEFCQDFRPPWSIAADVGVLALVSRRPCAGDEDVDEFRFLTECLLQHHAPLFSLHLSDASSVPPKMLKILIAINIDIGF